MEASSKVFVKYYNRFSENHDAQKAYTLATLFEKSFLNAEESAYELMPQMKQRGELFLQAHLNGVRLCVWKNNEVLESHYIMMEEALLLHQIGIAKFDENSIKFFKQFGFC